MTEMLLRRLNVHELEEMLARHQGLSPAPHLLDRRAVVRARRLVKKNAVREQLDALEPGREIPVLRRSHYRAYERTGDRRLPQSGPVARRNELSLATLALWLGHPKADRDYLQDLMWAYCDDWTWVMAAHEQHAIDLGSAALGAQLAEILHVFGDQLEEEVRRRVARTIEERLFAPYLDYRRPPEWRTKRNNWNHVCNGQFIRAALYLVDDPRQLAHMVHLGVQGMTYALDGFADDGGCFEGPGYWVYGFGHYLLTAAALYQRTGGELNIMTDDSGKIERICRYPLAAHIAGPLRATFSDSSHGCLPALPPLLINTFLALPELYPLCALHPDRTLQVTTMDELALYDGFRVDRSPDGADRVLPDLGMAKLRSAPGKNQLTLLCQAGHNAAPHNHNDIGSFIVHKNRRLVLDDPGGPVYRRETFGPHRYEILFCGAQGHSLPVINGLRQQAGAQYAGTLRVAGSPPPGSKQAIIDMTGAYPAGTVESYRRLFTVDVAGHALEIEDEFVFARPPRSLVECFVTYETVRPGPEAVVIGPRNGGVTLAAEKGAGEFTAERLTAESRSGRTGRVLTRISFRPAALERRMTLRFRIA